MTEVLWPLDLCPSSQTWNIIGNAATFTSPLSGATRTYGRPGARMGCTMTFPPMKGQDRARLLAFINTLLDRSNRAWVPDFSTTRRGAFPVSELLTNNDFSNGTTGWSVVSGSLSASGRTLRVTNTRSAGVSGFGAYQTGMSVTQYAPYALRGFIASFSRAGIKNGSSFDGSQNVSTDEQGLVVESAVVSGTTISGNVYPGTFDYDGIVALAGDYGDISFSSLSRCFLVDGGGNRQTYSDQFDNAAWAKTNATVTANDTGAPDGTTTADALVENTTNGDHSIQQSFSITSSAQDVCASFHLKSGTRSWAYVGISDAVANDVYVWVNLSTGTVGTTTSSGTNITSPRAFVVSRGDGWYEVQLVARKSGSQTSLIAVTGAATGNGTSSYAGVAAAKALYLWRGGALVTSVPARMSQSTTAAVSTSSQTGAGIYVKGLPASTQGLLEAGDPVQIGGQINFLTARLDSDAAGKGYLQCGRPWLAATNDAPVIVHQPMCKMILATDTIDLDTGPGQFSPFQIELVEAIE